MYATVQSINKYKAAFVAPYYRFIERKQRHLVPVHYYLAHVVRQRFLRLVITDPCKLFRVCTQRRMSFDLWILTRDVPPAWAILSTFDACRLHKMVGRSSSARCRHPLNYNLNYGPAHHSNNNRSTTLCLFFHFSSLHFPLLFFFFLFFFLFSLQSKLRSIPYLFFPFRLLSCLRLLII